MATVIYSNRGAASSSLGVSMSESLSDFISSANDRAMELLTDVGRGFIDRASRFRERVDFDSITRLRDRMARSFRRFREADEFMELIDLTEIQLAKPKMRRFIMAEPELRTLYRSKRIHGYNGEFGHDDPTTPVDQTPEYLHVTNGVLIEDTYRRTSNEEIANLERYFELSLSTKVDIMCTWDRAKAYLKYSKIDPTSEYDTRVD